MLGGGGKQRQGKLNQSREWRRNKLHLKVNIEGAVFIGCLHRRINSQ